MGYSENIWVNLVGFQLVWWSLILFGDLSIPFALLLNAAHLYFHSDTLGEALAVFITASIGYSLDLTLSQIGLFRFDEISGFTPWWLVVLWLGFCCTLRQGLAFLKNRVWLSALFGGVGASTTYLAAERLGAMTIEANLLTAGAIIGVCWALLLPLLLMISSHLERVNHSVTQL